MTAPRAFLKDHYPVESVPIASPMIITFADVRTGQRFKGYVIDVKALTSEELHAIYQEIHSRLSGTPDFNAWRAIIIKEGMPIREERVSSVMLDPRMVL